MSGIKISVVTPSYNQGSFIEEAIQSVLKQKYSNVEHIIIDGGSTDNTIMIFNKYPHLKWVSEPDKGQSDALNKGFKKATGDLIAWLNADDYFLPGAFHKVTQLFTKNPSMDVIYGNCYFVDTKGNILIKGKEIAYDKGILFYVGCYIPSSGSFFNRNIFDEGFFLDIIFDITMDYEFFVRLSKAGKQFMHLPEFLFCFRWHQENKSLNLIKRRQERERVQQMWGIKLFHSPNWNQRYYNFMFRIYLAKRVFKKLISGCYF